MKFTDPISKRVQIVRQRLMSNQLNDVVSEFEVLKHWFVKQLKAASYIQSSHFNHSVLVASL